MTSESPAILSDGLIRAAAAAAPVTVSSRTDDMPASWDERTVLVAMLDYARDTGVRPRRPQVRPLGGLRPWPDSSSQHSQAPGSAAVLL